MHVRFVSPVIDPDTRVETGFFQAYRYVPRTRVPDWIQRELGTQFYWFNRNLNVPDEFGRHFRRRNSIWGVCWFKDEAKECIERAHYCAWLLGEVSMPIRMLKHTVRKEIIWQDDAQVLCKPNKAIPRAFN